MEIERVNVPKRPRHHVVLELLVIGLVLTACSDPETTRGTMQRAVPPRLDSEVSELAPDGRRLAIAAVDHRVLVLVVEKGEMLAACAGAQSEPVSIDWRPDGE